MNQVVRPMRVDLHTHTCLSPCGDARMIPPRILALAAKRDIDVIGITDHNTAENVSALKEIAGDFGLSVIGGMEVTSEEEAHVLAFFDDERELRDFQSFIYAHLHGANSPENFGHQWVVDAEGGVLDINPRLLIGATELSVHKLTEAVHERNGAAIAAHVDRQAFSVLSQLGFIPADLALDAVELSPFYAESGFDPDSTGRPWVTFSDAHYEEEIGRSYTELLIAAPTVSEIKKALAAEDGRNIGRSFAARDGYR